MVNGKEVMTGQEWYERFEKELGDDVKYCASVPYICTCDLLEAAKRAAGLEQP
jgi:hypothetical protein